MLTYFCISGDIRLDYSQPHLKVINLISSYAFQLLVEIGDKVLGMGFLTINNLDA